MTLNNINNTSSDLTVDNLSINANTLSSVSGDLIVESDGTNEIIFNNGTSDLMIMSSDGEQTLPLQPSFLAYANADVLNQTGSGTIVDVGFNTEVFDVGGNYASDVFTAPVDGKYLLTTTVSFYNITSSMDNGWIRIVTSNVNFQFSANFYNLATPTFEGSISLSCICQMEAADTASVKLRIQNGASNTADLAGDATDLVTYFSGQLLS